MFTFMDRVILNKWAGDPHRSSLLSSRNVRWPSHGEYADGTDRQTDEQTDGRQTVTLRLPPDETSIINEIYQLTDAVKLNAL